MQWLNELAGVLNIKSRPRENQDALRSAMREDRAMDDDDGADDSSEHQKSAVNAFYARMIQRDSDSFDYQRAIAQRNKKHAG